LTIFLDRHVSLINRQDILGPGVQGTKTKRPRERVVAGGFGSRSCFGRSNHSGVSPPDPKCLKTSLTNLMYGVPPEEATLEPRIEEIKAFGSPPLSRGLPRYEKSSAKINGHR
jgi:hypothetical protein